jgi:2-dehydropantoate 2-reductase
MLARAGAPVTLIGRAAHVEVMARDGLELETLQFQQRVPVAASVEVSAVRDAELVLLCVKTLDTGAAAAALQPHLASGACVVSLQNGVDNVERIRTATGIAAIAAVVYVAAEMTAPGHVRHTGRGDLVVGAPGGGRRDELERLQAVFLRAGVPCTVSPNIEGELWAKLIMNCAYNAISALGRARYGRIVRHAAAQPLMHQVTQEVLEVGRAAGVRFPEADLLTAVDRLGEAMPNATSSTAQDLARGKRTEIDALNGYVARRGEELGVPTPINRTLSALVKLLEENA